MAADPACSELGPHFLLPSSVVLSAGNIAIDIKLGVFYLPQPFMSNIFCSFTIMLLFNIAKHGIVQYSYM